ncbi:hypothetical protein [Streptomyces sp. OK228]|uniref:hypothetical protein n=1 Tax=Streptomyces sp. OK228 TaxID=1882786 RepID=UPI000BC4D612|nr:hypothetical protein [Streptomyces sp. OK228]SOE19294.1 hypothetical protein SAMN05442782_0269 [Streptomyces sp. OK228]
MASVLGILEEREADARVRVEGLREETARLAEVLDAAEIELDRRVIAREELVEALALSASETTAVTEAGQETVLSAGAGVGGAALAGRAADVRARARLPADSGRAGGAAVRGQWTGEDQGDRGELGFGTTSAKVEGVRSRARRLAERGWLLLEASGMFSAGRRPVAVPDAGSSA